MASLISLDDLSRQRLDTLVDRSVTLFRDRGAHDRPLAGTVAGMLFLHTSTRTRLAFSSGAARLGADLIGVGPHDLQLNTGESLADTGRILASMLDLVVLRSGRSNADLRMLAQDGRLPVVNAMSVDEHPTQAVSDLATLRLRRGDLTGIRFLYVGEGNNSAVALAKALSAVPGAHATFWTPPGYGLDDALIDRCHAAATTARGSVEQVHGGEAVPIDADVVYTTRWNTTGTTKSDPGWRDLFRPYHVDGTFLKAHPNALVMHDLPAHRGDEISGEVLDGPQSIAWIQAEMKLPSAMAVLEHAVLERP
ncbi:MAG: ornithine carbamoyltransferase [Actinoplanes sp.]